MASTATAPAAMNTQITMADGTAATRT
jgi:hypothetical protein